MTQEPNIFISYSWQTQKIAEKIAYDLSLIGISIIKDNKELKYTDSIMSFMKRIRSSDFALLLISDSYLKSKNCLVEILELQKDESYWKKVLPIVCENTKIYTPLERIEYVQFWQQKTKELEIALEGINPINATELFVDLKLFKDITFNIDSFLKKISDSLHLSPDQLIEENYISIFEKLGLEFNPKGMIELLKIALNQNLESREIELENYLQKYPESGFFYSIKGGTSRDLKKYNQAIHYYKKGLELDSSNYEMLNNLGQIYDYIKKEFKLARLYYEKSIDSKPDLDIPRLNLGVLLKNEFNDKEGAKKQYEAILSFDPKNARAHNNLANHYKTGDIENDNIEMIEFHLKQAIDADPNFIEALIGYGNFLKVYKKEFELGNSYYKRVRELDKEQNFKEMIDTLLKSKKG